MIIGHAYITHLEPRLVELGLRNLEKLFPTVPRILCYGGDLENFEKIAHEPKIFLEDPTIRSWKEHMAGDLPYLCFEDLPEKLLSVILGTMPGVTHLHVSEYDHLIVDSRYFELLKVPWASENTGLVGKCCRSTNASNWAHSFRYLKDGPFLDFLESFSIRSNRHEIFGMLGNGFTISRVALESLVALTNKPMVNYELLLPTVIHHLGYDVADMAEYTDLYRWVRWGPKWPDKDILEMLQGGSCCHPEKNLTEHSAMIERAVGFRNR